MKRLVLLSFLFVAHMSAWACEVCKKQQPRALRGITHGAGPQGDWDYVIVCIIALIVLVSLFYSVKWILRPGEKEAGHIKRQILNFD